MATTLVSKQPQVLHRKSTGLALHWPRAITHVLCWYCLGSAGRTVQICCSGTVPPQLCRIVLVLSCLGTGTIPVLNLYLPGAWPVLPPTRSIPVCYRYGYLAGTLLRRNGTTTVLFWHSADTARYWRCAGAVSAALWNCTGVGVVWYCVSIHLSYSCTGALLLTRWSCTRSVLDLHGPCY